MNSWMCFQTVRLCKRLWTKITTEWFFPCMNSWMYFQMVRLWKRLCTKSTTEWFLSCMNSGMNTELWWIPEGFITHWTPEASLWMTSQMNLENVWCRKRLCTLGTTMKILSCSCYFISEINVCQTIFLRLLVQEKLQAYMFKYMFSNIACRNPCWTRHLFGVPTQYCINYRSEE